MQKDPAPKHSTDARILEAVFSNNVELPILEIAKQCPNVTWNVVAPIFLELPARIERSLLDPTATMPL